MPVYLQLAYADLVYSAVMFPHTKAAAREVLSLRMLSDLSCEQQRRIRRQNNPVGLAQRRDVGLNKLSVTNWTRALSERLSANTA
jgi:hypothetical protein